PAAPRTSAAAGRCRAHRGCRAVAARRRGRAGAPRRCRGRAKEHEAELGKLDAVAGDGDHGQGMVLGAVGAADRGHEAAAAGVGLGTLLREVGEAWAESAGGTSGALWGAALVAAGERLGDTDAPSAADVAEAVSAAVGAMKDMGKAELGDKT